MPTTQYKIISKRKWHYVEVMVKYPRCYQLKVPCAKFETLAEAEQFVETQRRNNGRRKD